MPIELLLRIKTEPELLVNMKTQCFLIDPVHFIWTYPQFQPQKKQEDMSDVEDNADFNDLETDERFNNDIIQFDFNFPDPMHYSIGFMGFS